MSQPQTQAGPSKAKGDPKTEAESRPESKPEVRQKTWVTKAALLPLEPGSLDGDFIASQALGSPVDVEVHLVAATTFGMEGLRFSLSFPRATIEASEEIGFGVCHKCKCNYWMSSIFYLPPSSLSPSCLPPSCLPPSSLPPSCLPPSLLPPCHLLPSLSPILSLCPLNIHLSLL